MSHTDPNAKSSEELLSDFAHNRSEGAFHELVRRYLPIVYNTALRVTNGDPHLAEDIAQIVFTDFAAKAARLSSGTIVAGWLHQHTWFTASKTIRTERRRALRERQSIDMSTFTTEVSEAAQIQPLVDEALTSLNREDRDALVLRFFESADLRRIGASFGISEDAAQKRVARALERLRAVLEARGVTVSSMALTAFLAAQSTAAPLSLPLAQTVSTAALAGVVSTPWLVTFFGSTKAKLSVAALLAGAVATPLIWQQSAVSHLRTENTALRAALAPLENLKAENDGLRTQTFSRADIERLNKDLAELRRLRGEVTLLRRELSAGTNKVAGVEQEPAEASEEEEILSVNVKSQLVEADYQSLSALFSERFPAIANRLLAQRSQTAVPDTSKAFTFILEPDQADELTELFKETSGVTILSAPQIITGNGRQGRVSVEHQMGMPSGETIPLGLSIDLLPKIMADRTGVSLEVKARNIEFLGWETADEPVPRLRTREAAQDAILRFGQMLIIAAPAVRDSGDPEEKIQIYCFRSTVIRPNGEPYEPRTQLRAANGENSTAPR